MWHSSKGKRKKKPALLKSNNFTNINSYGMELWKVKVIVQIFRKNFYSQIDLNKVKVKFKSLIKKWKIYVVNGREMQK